MRVGDSTNFQWSADGRFATTRWTIVAAAARQTDSPEARRALESLCQVYWFPLYAYLRRRGYDKDRAEDFTQAFFAHLLEKDGLRHVEPGKHRFRSFLLASLKNSLTDDWRRRHAQKRGGGHRVVPLEVEEGERRYLLEPQEDVSPEQLFQRSWALTVIRRALEALRYEYDAAGKLGLFERLKGKVTQASDAGSHAEAAADLGMSEGAARVAVHRMRARLRELIRAEVAQTVASPQEVEAEIGDLFAALGQ